MQERLRRRDRHHPRVYSYFGCSGTHRFLETSNQDVFNRLYMMGTTYEELNRVAPSSALPFVLFKEMRTRKTHPVSRASLSSHYAKRCAYEKSVRRDDCGISYVHSAWSSKNSPLMLSKTKLFSTLYLACHWQSVHKQQTKPKSAQTADEIFQCSHEIFIHAYVVLYRFFVGVSRNGTHLDLLFLPTSLATAHRRLHVHVARLWAIAIFNILYY